MRFSELEQFVWDQFDPSRLMGIVEQISSFHRVKGTPGIDDAIAWVSDQLSHVPSIQIETHRFPCDGRLTYGTWRAPINWKLNTAEVILKSAGGREIPLIDASNMNTGIYSYSGSVPEHRRFSIIAHESLEGLENRELHPDTRRSKIVLSANPTFIDLWRYFYEIHLGGIISVPDYGAAGEDPTLIDTRRWHTLPLTGRENYRDRESIPFGISLSQRQGNLVKDVLRDATCSAGFPELIVKIDSMFNSGTFPVLQITIHGTGPVREYTILTAHICHPSPSAHDNASGVAGAIQTALTAAQLYQHRDFKRSDRGIIILLVPEILGTLAWLLRPDTAALYFVAGLNMDMIGSNPQLTGAETHLVLPPLSARTFFPWIASYFLSRSSKAERYCADAADNPYFKFKTRPFSIGSDHHILNFPGFGIPSVSLGCWPDKYYHTDADTPDKLNPEILKRLAWSAAMSVFDITRNDPSSAQKIIRYHAQLLLNRLKQPDLDIDVIQRFLNESMLADQLYPEISNENLSVLDELKDQFSKLGLKPDYSSAPFYPELQYIIPHRQYVGPISRTAVFEQSNGKRLSHLEKLSGCQEYRKLSAIASAEMLIDGERTVDGILAALEDNHISLDAQLFLETLDQLQEFDFIAWDVPR